MLKSLFNKVACLKVCNVLKKRLQHRFVSCEYYEIFKNNFWTEHLWWLLRSLLSSLKAVENHWFSNDFSGEQKRTMGRNRLRMLYNHKNLLPCLEKKQFNSTVFIKNFKCTIKNYMNILGVSNGILMKKEILNCSKKCLRKFDNLVDKRFC